MNLQLTVYIEEQLIDAFKQAAFDKKRKVSHLVSDAMRDYLHKHHIQPKSQKTPVGKKPKSSEDLRVELSRLIELISEQASAIADLRGQVSHIKSVNEPVVYEVPQGEFTGIEEEILRIVCAAGEEGINHGVFQNEMASLNFRKNDIDPTVKDLMARALLKKRRHVYVYLRPGERAAHSAKRQS